MKAMGDSGFDIECELAIFYERLKNERSKLLLLELERERKAVVRRVLFYRGEWQPFDDVRELVQGLEQTIKRLESDKDGDVDVCGKRWIRYKCFMDPFMDSQGARRAAEMRAIQKIRFETWDTTMAPL